MKTPRPRRFVLEFTKMSGAGNDFIVIDNRFYRFPPEELSGFAARFCPRRSAVGADGLLALCLAESEEYDYRMRYYNADGSLGSMCGNGARCLARFAREAGIEAEPLRFESDAGPYSANVPDEPEEDVTIWLPPYRDFRPGLISTSSEEPVHFIWTGTEHVVLFKDEVASLKLENAGPNLRFDAALSQSGANVDFVELVDPATVKVRTWEKGVEAETLACGTGAVASALVAALVGKVARKDIHVRMPGGTLHVGWEGDVAEPTAIYLKGPADTVYRGTLEL